MSEALNKPYYAAFLLDPSDMNRELTPLIIADATSNESALSFAERRGVEWLRAQRMDRAILHIVKDGNHGIFSDHLKAAG